MTLSKPLYQTIDIKSWNDLTAYYEKNRKQYEGWLFRGQGKSGWLLEPTLERALTRLDVPLSEAPQVEDGLVRKFRRQMHLYPEEVLIVDPNFMETLAMIQHHGGPTRLLDWSYSFFVGAYFAVEAAESTDTCAIWALDKTWWRTHARSLLPKKVQSILAKDGNAKADTTARAILKHKPRLKTIHPLNAFRLSERHVYQQGAFIAPGDIAVSFMDNLHAISTSESAKHVHKIEVTCSSELLRDALRSLHRMNINRASLFPGLDGFVMHFQQLIVIPDARATDDDAAA